jgi:hypothetical protein
MPVEGKEGHSGLGSVFLAEACGGGIGAFVDFGDEDKGSTGFEDTHDFANVVGKVGPEEVGFHGGDEIEGVG